MSNSELNSSQGGIRLKRFAGISIGGGVVVVRDSSGKGEAKGAGGGKEERSWTSVDRRYMPYGIKRGERGRGRKRDGETDHEV